MRLIRPGCFDSPPKILDFVIIGAAKAGTTTLTAWLRRQEGVFVPKLSEPGFFAWDGKRAPRRWETSVPATVLVRSAEAFAALYASAPAGALRGDISPLYLESSIAAERLFDASPGLKLVVSLRDPVRRAWSDYEMHVRDGLEHRAPEIALAPGEHSVRAGEYAHLLPPFLERFGREAVHVMVFEEWTAEPRSALAAIADFLGLPAPIDFDIGRENTGGRPRYRRLYRAFSGASPAARLARSLPEPLQDAGRRLRASLSTPSPGIPRDLAMRLAAHYRPDRHAVAALLGRKPRGWLEC